MPELIGALRSILGLERRWQVALIGAGKIGAALLARMDRPMPDGHETVLVDGDAAAASYAAAWRKLVGP